MSLSDHNQDILNQPMSRRDVIALGLASAVSALIPTKVFAAPDNEAVVKELSFYNVSTHEDLKVAYWKNGMYLPEGLARINHIFRDIRTGREREIDINLLDLLHAVKEKINCDNPYHIISGYRTAQSNALLSRHNKNVAKNSLHIYGKAVDVRIPGYSLKKIRKTAMKFKAGGVGYYPRSKFLHIDVGEVRYWWG